MSDDAVDGHEAAVARTPLPRALALAIVAGSGRLPDWHADHVVSVAVPSDEVEPTD